MQRTVPQRDRSKGYWRFLDTPVPVVLVVLWLMGTAILGACGLTLCALVAALVGA